jgi:uncharacterized protein
MQLYAGHSTRFIEDTVQNQIAGKLKQSFFDHYRFNASDSEVRSWHNSLTRMKDVFQRANLIDHGVVLEYQLPLTSKRLDCMITGKAADSRDNAVIVELKQWDKCESADGENEVITWTGNGHREVLHPSVQVGRYEMYLRDVHTAFYDGDNPVDIHSCGYLHNYSFEPRDVLKAPKYRQALESHPLFSADDVDPLCVYLNRFLNSGDGMPILTRIQESKFRPSKKLMEHVSATIKEKPEYVLLDEQLVAYDAVIASVKRGFHDKQKTVVLVQGGPGTGKSVIAINLMAELARQGINAHYATGSKSFTETLRKVIGPRGAVQFKYFNSYGQAAADEIDVLICDESHRVRRTSANRFTPKEKRTGKPQLEELLNAARVPVFFIDDFQIVRPGEIGSSTLIRDAVARHGYRLREYQLEAQFRCAGSEAFVNWIENTLDVRPTANSIWEAEEKFEFKIFDSPQGLENAIRRRVAEGSSGRVMAGFCWKWSDPLPDGTLPDDVIIGDYHRPWDAKPDAKKLAKGIPKASLWAHDPNGINQVGCVYTAQGFEFDYAGVIFGPDLVYDPETGTWKGNRDASADSVVKRGKDQFLACVKNVYRVLLSRGLKGCYVHFMDSNTRNFFVSRMRGAFRGEDFLDAKPTEESVSFPSLDILESVPSVDQFMTYLPVYSLAAAAGGFSDEQIVKPLGWAKVENRKLTKDMFISRVKGRSMEPLIPNDSWCIFKKDPGGSREGKVVLVQCNSIHDAETSGRFTVKRYHSEKELFENGTWRHKKITLSPQNNAYTPIVLENIEADFFHVVAEWVANI